MKYSFKYNRFKKKHLYKKVISSYKVKAFQAKLFTMAFAPRLIDALVGLERKRRVGTKVLRMQRYPLVMI